MSAIHSATRLGIACACVVSSAVHAAPPAPSPAATAAVVQKTFGTPEAASEALVAAAERFDVDALKGIVGPDGIDLVVTHDAVQDKQRSAEFAAEARKKMRIERDAKKPGTAVLVVGQEDWPMPIPLVQTAGAWRFDSKAGRQEVLNRRVGENELDAIEICHGFVEAQHEYASQKHDGSTVNQYAQRIISTPGRQDGLAWQKPDGTWDGPVGEAVGRAIAQGYGDKRTPFHGYYFKVLKGQGPAAPLGEIDFVVRGVMIGGFALAAAPADYAVTGVKTFIVSHTGIVYEKDLGPKTLERFRAMERYNPDSTWSVVEEP